MRNMVKFAVVVAGSLLIISACSYDPEPVGCSFRIQSTSGFEIAGVPISVYSIEDSLPPDTLISIIAAALDSGECPVEFDVSVFIRNDNTAGKVIVTDIDWICLLNMEGAQVTVDSGESTWPIRVNAGETRNIPCSVNFNAAQLLYGEYTTSEILDLCYALGGKNRDLRDGDHLGRVSMQLFVTEETPHGLIDNRGPVTVNLEWIQP